MHPFRYHVFACDQRKPEGVSCCSARGSLAVIDAMRRELAARGLLDCVQLTTCGSIGLCERGPNLVVYPEGVWYSGVSPADVPELVSEHFQNGRPLARLANTDAAALRREIDENRARFVAAAKARDAAGVVPDDLMDAVRGYQPSRVVLTALELDVFTAVARSDADATAEGLAAAVGTDARATAVLLNALVALGLLAKQDGVFANAPLAARYLVDGAPDDARLALRHNVSLWATWSALTGTVRSGRPAIVDMGRRGDEWTQPFIAAMHRNAMQRAPLVLAAVGADRVGRLLDIGGGSGAYSIAFARANPQLHADIFDLATVVPIAERNVTAAGVAGRVRTRIGDLRTDPFGSGYDLALLSAICHMLGPAENRDLFRRVRAALAPTGRVVIQDHVMNPDKTAPRAGALFAVNMLVGTPEGGTYSEAEYSTWLAEAGLQGTRRVRLGGPNDLIIATRPPER